ncbi:type III pantothenate kinase [Roseimarinus sediminis]|jgi:type III pantothenate kinase|uniref:type III pantothenate kinase n=1 Tax=Roseimarinus sediminis TaxID=1610899 RepID=UPI003D1DE4AD
MNLIIDIGNTRTKIAIFKKEEMLVRFTTDTLMLSDIDQLLSDYPEIQCAIVSSVRTHIGSLIHHLQTNLGFVIELNHNTPLPVKNCYETPETLGKDRIAAAVGANHLYPNTDLLIIDAGTAVTYDHVNKKNEYLGGFITPGLAMRFRALHEFTDRLPHLKPGMPDVHSGSSTNDAILGGIQLGLEGELIRIIKHFADGKSDLIIILTGGDTNYFEKLLKNYKFVALEITLLGLNTILTTNYTQLQNEQ